MEKFNKIILNVPHSSIERYNEGWRNSTTFFNEVKQLTDWHTDVVFKTDKAFMCRFPYSRFYVDVERLINDPMEKIGQGILYTDYNEYERTITNTSRDELMASYYVYRNLLSNLLSEHSILIDCHSFSDKTNRDIDVCIGFNEDESKPSEDTLLAIAECFREKGYKVGFNRPYSNSLTPKKPIDYKSVMIELNKRTYMDEKTLLLIPECKVIMACLDKCYSSLKAKATECVGFSRDKTWMEKTTQMIYEAVEAVLGQYMFYNDKFFSFNSIYFDANRIEVCVCDKVLAIGYTRKTLEKDLEVIAVAAEGFWNLTNKYSDLLVDNTKTKEAWLSYLDDLFVLQGIMYNKHKLPLFEDGKMIEDPLRIMEKTYEVKSDREKALKEDTDEYVAGLERLPNYKPVYFEKRPHAGVDPF